MKINPLWFVCLLCRFLLALLAKKIGNKNKTYKYGFTILFLFIGLPFIPKGIYGSNDEVQIAKVFWHETRITHGILYTLAAYYIYVENLKLAYVLILTDIVFSILYRIVFNK